MTDFPEIIVSKGVSADSILLYPGPRKHTLITDGRTGKTYLRWDESMEEYARRCMLIKLGSQE